MKKIYQYLLTLGVVLVVVGFVGSRLNNQTSQSKGGYNGNGIFSNVQPVSTGGVATSTGANTITNPGFETLFSGFPSSWATSTLAGSPTISITTTAHAGSVAVQMTGDQNNIEALNSTVLTGLTPGASYLVSFYGRTMASTDGMPTALVTNDIPSISTQVYNVLTGAWDTSSFGAIFGGNPTAYLVAGGVTSTVFSKTQQLVIAPANGKLDVILINAPNGNNSLGNVIFDDVAVQSFTPGSPASVSVVNLFDLSSPVDKTNLVSSSSVFRVQTLGGTPKIWLSMLSDGLLRADGFVVPTSLAPHQSIIFSNQGELVGNNNLSTDGSGHIFMDQTITPIGTTGNQTINKAFGVVNIASGQGSVIVTDSLVTPSSSVFAMKQASDGLTYVTNVVVSSGTFTINLNTQVFAATMPIAFLVIN